MKGHVFMRRIVQIALLLMVAGILSRPSVHATPLAPQAVSVGISSPANGSVQTSTSVTLTGTSTPGATLSLVIDGGTPISVTADAAGNWTYNATLAQGSHTAIVTATRPETPRLYASYIRTSTTLDQVFAMNTETNTLIAPAAGITLASNGVEGLALLPNGSQVYAAHEDGVSIIDPATNAIIGMIPLPVGAQLARVTPDGAELWVTQPATDQIAIIDTATNTVKGTLTLGRGQAPHDIVFRPDGAVAYIPGTESPTGSITAYTTTAPYTELRFVTQGLANRRATLSRSGQRVYVSAKNSNEMRVLETVGHTFISTIGGMAGPEGMDESADGSRLYVVQRDVNQVWTYSTATLTRIPAETYIGFTSVMDVIVDPYTGVLYVGDNDSIAVYAPGSTTPTANVVVNAAPDLQDRVYEFDLQYQVAQAQATSTFTVNATADLTIVKTALNAPWTVGQQGQYTLAVHNLGPAPAQPTMTVSDTLPVGTTFVSASGTGWACGASGQVVTCTRATALASGTTAPLITLTVTIGAAAAPSVTNTACVSNPNEGNSANNCSSVTTTIIPQADLSIIKAALNAPWIVGQQTQYTLAVANAGPNTAAAPITVTDTLPASLTFVSATGTGWACGASGQAITCTRATALASGTTAPLITLTVTIGAAAAPSVTNTATVSTPTPETSSGNNTSTVTTPVLVPQLAIQKRATPPNGTAVAAFDIITYTLRVENTGTLPLTNVRITDTIPLGTAYVPGSAQPAPITGPSPLVWSLPTLAVGQIATVSFAVEIQPIGTTVAITNTAQASSSQTPPIISEEIIHPFDPTSVTLVRLTARWVGDEIEVNWETSLEPDTAGFHLYGSNTTVWPTASVQTAALIPSQGSTTTGGVYQRLLAQQPGFSRPGPLYVWLEEREMNGTIHRYGPVAVQQTIFVPLIQR